MEKPELTYRQRPGQFGEIVEELTPESELAWSNYLTQKNLARRALYATENMEKADEQETK